MKETIIISPTTQNKRIDCVCADVFPAHSRSAWSKWGTFMLNEKAVPGKTKTKSEQRWQVSIRVPESDWKDLPPWNVPLNILHDSETYLVVEKPVGVSSHPSASDPSTQTLVNALVAHFGDKLAQNELRPGLAHRLDKDTSGALIIAKTDDTLRHFQTHWNEVEKYYRATIQGTPKSEKGIIVGDIARHPKDRKKMAVVADGEGKSAKTGYEIDWSEGQISHLICQLFTGRTHQIRVHLTAIGHPIIGDKIYGSTPAKRMMLHAERLCFTCPDTQEPISVRCPAPF